MLEEISQRAWFERGRGGRGSLWRRPQIEETEASCGLWLGRGAGMLLVVDVRPRVEVRLQPVQFIIDVCHRVEISLSLGLGGAGRPDDLLLGDGRRRGHWQGGRPEGCSSCGWCGRRGGGLGGNPHRRRPGGNELRGRWAKAVVNEISIDEALEVLLAPVLLEVNQSYVFIQRLLLLHIIVRSNISKVNYVTLFVILVKYLFILVSLINRNLCEEKTRRDNIVVSFIKLIGLRSLDLRNENVRIKELVSLSCRGSG